MKNVNRLARRVVLLLAAAMASVIAPNALATLTANPASVSLVLEGNVASVSQKVSLSGDGNTLYAAFALKEAPIGLRSALSGCPDTDRSTSLSQDCILTVSYAPKNRDQDERINTELTLSYRVSVKADGTATQAAVLRIPVSAIYTAPAKDTDGDGIPDPQDQCPNLAGNDEQGCPNEAQIAQALLQAAGSSSQLHTTATALSRVCATTQSGELGNDCAALVDAAVRGSTGVKNALAEITPQDALLAMAAVQRTHTVQSRHIGDRLVAVRRSAKGGLQGGVQAVTLAGFNALITTHTQTLRESSGLGASTFNTHPPMYARDALFNYLPTNTAFDADLSLASLDLANLDSNKQTAVSELGIAGNNTSTADNTNPSEALLFTDSDWGLFLSAEFTRSQRDTRGLGSAFEASGWVATGGLDYRPNANTVLGIAATAVRSDAKLADNTGGLDRDETSLTVYGSVYRDAWYVDLAVSTGSSSYQQSRSVGYSLGNGTAVSQQMNADYDGSAQSAHASLGWDGNWPWVSDQTNQGTAAAWSVGLRASVDYLKAKADAFTEQPGDPAGAGAGWAVNVDAQSQEWLTARLSASTRRVITAPWGVLVPFIEVDLIQEFANQQNTVNTRFVSDASNTTLAVTLEDADHSYVRARLGSTFQLPGGVAGFVDYGRLFAFDRWHAYTLSAGVRYEF